MNNKYKILVLSDLKKASKKTVKSTVSLAKMIDADIDLFSVREPLEIGPSENQFSTMRKISEEYKKVKKEINKISENVEREFGLIVNNNVSIGNVKTEILGYIKKCNPDIIVIGKKKSKLINITPDDLTGWILNNFEGLILIASDKNVIEPYKTLSLGMLNSKVDSFDKTVAKIIMNQSQKPLLSFKSSTHSPKGKEDDANKTVEFVFEKSNAFFENLSSYLNRNEVDLLCCDRSENNKEIIKNVDVSLLINRSKSYIKN